MESTKSLVRINVSEDVCIIDKINVDGKVHFKVLRGWPVSFMTREFLSKLNKCLEGI